MVQRNPDPETRVFALIVVSRQALTAFHVDLGSCYHFLNYPLPTGQCKLEYVAFLAFGSYRLNENAKIRFVAVQRHTGRLFIL